MHSRVNLAHVLFEVTLKYGHDNAETAVVPGTAIDVVEIEQTGIRTVEAIATTLEEVARIREVRVIAVPATRARAA